MEKFQVIKDTVLGRNTRLFHFINLYGCRIGDDCMIGSFVEIQKNVSIGNKCKISSHSFICEGVTIDDGVFVGHGVIFINDKYPVAQIGGKVTGDGDWKPVPTRIGRGVSIGSGSIILSGVQIGEEAMIGAGAVVTKDVLPHEVVAGVPARVMQQSQAQKLKGCPNESFDLNTRV